MDGGVHPVAGLDRRVHGGVTRHVLEDMFASGRGECWGFGRSSGGVRVIKLVIGPGALIISSGVADGALLIKGP